MVEYRGRGPTDKEALQEAVDAFWAAWDRGEMGRPKQGDRRELLGLARTRPDGAEP